LHAAGFEAQKARFTENGEVAAQERFAHTVSKSSRDSALLAKNACRDLKFSSESPSGSLGDNRLRECEHEQSRAQ
jgi:hypothetical protein